MQNIDVQDIVKTAYEKAGEFIVSYNVFWDKNQIPVAGRLGDVKITAESFKDFLLKDESVSYEYKKTALQMAVAQFCSLQDRLVFHVLKTNGEERRDGLAKYIKNLAEMRGEVLSRANKTVLEMLEMEKK